MAEDHNWSRKKQRFSVQKVGEVSVLTTERQDTLSAAVSCY